MSGSMIHCRMLVASLVILVSGAVGARAELVPRDLLEPGDGLITLDTSTGLEWLDVTRTVGLSINAVRVDFGGLPAGRLATEEEVVGLFLSAGVFDVGGTCLENEPGVRCLLDMMGVTFVDVSGGFGALALHDGGALDLGVASRARLRIGPQEDPVATADPDNDLVNTHSAFDDTGVFVVREVAVASPPGVERATARLHVSPNPFNPRTVIDFTMPASASVELVVFDVRGRRVRTLVHGVVAPGRQQVVWDGRDGAGRALASGTYFVRLSSPVFDRVDVKRAVLVR